MKKMIAILCCVCLLMGYGMAEADGTYWQCANCGEWNTTNYCGNCGYPRTEIALDGPNTSVHVRLNQRLATRSGPSTQYDELGSYFKAGTWLTALSAAWDDVNEIWWIQVEFQYQGKWRRAYTGLKRLDMDVSSVRTESQQAFVRTIRNTAAYYGPGTHYSKYAKAVPQNTAGVVYWVENGWAQLEFYDSTLNKLRRVWINRNDLVLQ